MLSIRPARPEDGADVRALLAQLGYEASAEEVRARLDHLSGHRTDPVLLAVEAGRVLGVIAMHWTPMLHHRRPVARITTLVVRDDARGKGIGRSLVEAGLGLAREAGCGVVELTTALHRTEAQSFYQAMGFVPSSLRLYRPLD